MKNTLLKLFICIFLFLFQNILFAEEKTPDYKQLELLQKELNDKVSIYCSYKDDEIFAKINDVTVSYLDIKIGYTNMLKNHLQIYKEKPLNETIAKVYLDTMIERAINNKVLLQEIERLKMSPSEEAINKKLSEFKATMDEKKYETFLKWNQISEEELKKQLFFKEGTDIYFKFCDEKVSPPSEAVLKDFYEKNLAKFTTPSKIRYSIIKILNSDESPGTKSKNKETLEKVRKDILDKKQTFEFYAKNYSDEEATRKTGGDSGLINTSELSTYLKQINEFETGKLSEVTEFEDGCYIVRVNEKQKENIPSFEEVKDRINKYLAKVDIQNNRKKILDALKKNSNIVYLKK